MRLKTIVAYSLLSLGITLIALPHAARAEEFPNQPLRLIIPYPPGGGVSLTGSAIATVSEKHFGQPVIPIIRQGGGGVVGVSALLSEEADGHTLLIGDITINNLRPTVEELSYSRDDFIPIARITYAPMVFTSGKHAPFTDLAGMIEYAKANPNNLVYADDQVNGWAYVAFEMLKLEKDLEMKGVHFSGGGPMIADVLGGNSMVTSTIPSPVIDHISAGNVNPICVTDSERDPSLQDVPTCEEAGAVIVWRPWQGIFVKAGTPSDRVDELRAGFRELVKDKGLIRMMKKFGAEIKYLDAPEFEKEMDAERSRLVALYEKLNLSAGK